MVPNITIDKERKRKGGRKKGEKKSTEMLLGFRLSEVKVKMDVFVSAHARLGSTHLDLPRPTPTYPDLQIPTNQEKII